MRKCKNCGTIFDGELCPNCEFTTNIPGIETAWEMNERELAEFHADTSPF